MSDQIDVNQLSNALQQKVDLPSGKSQADIDYVVEWQEPTAENNYTWYRLYKSGWVEQGGIITCTSSTNSQVVNLPKSMINTNYTAIAHFNATSAISDSSSQTGQSMNRWNGTVCSKSVSSFTMQATSINGGIYSWEVKGFASQS